MALKPNQLQVTTIHAQANAIIERVHKVTIVENIFRSFDLEDNHENLEKRQEKIIHLIILFNQMHAYYANRSTYHTTLQAIPCQLVFDRGVIQNISSRENWN
jgi:uncharacterized HAD superfamily protein